MTVTVQMLDNAARCLSQRIGADVRVGACCGRTVVDAFRKGRGYRLYSGTRKECFDVLCFACDVMDYTEKKGDD